MSNEAEQYRTEEGAGREATEWLILLSEDGEDAEVRARFDAWMACSAAHATAWAETQAISDAIRGVGIQQLEHAPIGGTILPFAPRQSRYGFRKRLRAVIWAGVAASLALIMLPNFLIESRSDFVANGHRVKSVALSDGTAVTLSPGSALAVSFLKTERRIRLLKGNAYFDVAHDAARPFRIAAGDSVTTVLGTAFEVREADAHTTVAVRRGTVQVACADDWASERLTVGETLDLTCHRQAVRGRIKPARVASWTTGQLVANDQPLEQVVAALRPWYGGLILLRGGGHERRVTGVYDLTHPEAALAALAVAHNGKVQHILPYVMVLSVN